MQVAQLADALNISRDTLRYYVRIGLISPNRSQDNGYQQFGAQDVRRMKFVLSARALGFSLDDVKQLLADADKGQSPCPHARDMIDKRLAQMEQRLADMQQLLAQMKAAKAAWSTLPDTPPTGQMICHLIEGVSARKGESA
ncbi:MerR family DNA-binding protein [Aliiglaciecola sp. CAU 1673]|uniref:MerR family DNA-binding protein n=1 Tax=Aliiglaciecola sp. CAU 1673 TaxID=3032595 RepID=UPI0023DA90CC|nr:MerR family DNA-binding protein [Aliiglaciecola sp. CAU 1673]MDF2179883.1 MerR family DNA-binding protein [Aliiglaciecola sp. CAU 1673]